MIVTSLDTVKAGAATEVTVTPAATETVTETAAEAVADGVHNP